MIDQLLLGLSSLFPAVDSAKFFEEELHLPANEIIEITTQKSWNAVTFFDPTGNSLPEISYYENDKWRLMELEDERDDLTGLIFFDDLQNSIIVKTSGEIDLVAHFFNSKAPIEGLTAKFEDNTEEYLEKKSIAQELDFGTNEIPRFYTRSEWGADESLRLSKKINKVKKWYQIEIDSLEPKFRPKTIRRTDDNGKPLYWPIMENSNIAKFVIHHTAENLQTERNRTAKEIMRAIYYYHTITRGWGDIGYNFVVDRFGNVYEGRAGYEKNERIPVGAHVAFRNVGTVGIALMGNFQEEKPTKAQINVLALLISDLGRQLNIDPLGNSIFQGKKMPNIVGHRQVAVKGHGTACPGVNMMKKLPELRKKVAEFTAELESFAKDGRKMGLDFLTGSPNQKSRLQRLRNNSNGIKKRALNPIWVHNPEHVPLIRRYESKTVDIYVTNRSNFSWKKSLSLSPQEIPEGMVISKFYLTGTTDAGKKGIFRGKIYVKNVPNGKYSFKLVPKFLGKELVDSQMKRATFRYEIQVSGDKNSLISSIRNTSFFKNLRTSIFKKDTTKSSITSIFSKNKPVPIVSSKNNYGPSVKIKLASFHKDYEEIMGSSSVIIWNKKERIAKIPAYTPIKIKFNKFVGKEMIIVSVGKDKIWEFSNRDDIVFNSAGFLELLKYQNPRFGGGKIKYNKFRGKLHFKIGEDRHFLVINELPLEQYLWGLGEEPSHEPINKKHTVFILARSYAYVYSGKRRKFGRYDYDLEDDPRTSQLYLGYDWERYHTDQKSIVNQTKGKVLFSLKEKRAVIGPYFTQSAGYSVNPWKKQYPWARERKLPYDEGLIQRGHGVGLSGNSARILAEKGATLQEIINYFFDGLIVKEMY
jgi:hypothetical protein